MDMIVDYLYISSLHHANNLEELNRLSIRAVISLGCAPNIPGITSHTCYPDITDTLDCVILHTFKETTQIIKSNLERQMSVLVHCIQGQSRSAVIILAYLISTGLSMQQGIDILKSKHPDTCINPSFLSQVHLFNNRSTFLAEYLLLISSKETNMSSRITKYTYLPPAKARVLHCRNCRAMLANELDIVDMSRCIRSQFSDSIDPFWREVMGSDLDRFPHQDTAHILGPLKWVADAIEENNQGGALFTAVELNCPSCQRNVGVYKFQGLKICENFLAVDLFSLSKKNVYLKKTYN